MYLTKRDYGLEKCKQSVWSAAMLGVSKRAVCLQISDSEIQLPEEWCVSYCPQGVYRIKLIGKMLNYQVASDINVHRT
jgi:hypothetical protein